MNRDRIQSGAARFVVFAGVLFAADRADACAVCFGDPNSSMAKGAVVGVLVLLGVIGFVLAGVVGTGVFWMHRIRRSAACDPSGLQEKSADRRGS